MEIWHVLLTVSIVLLVTLVYRIGFIKGYRKGAHHILHEWKEVMKIGEDDDNGEHL